MSEETREQREARWRSEHKWDGPMVSLEIGDVPSCSICGCDASEQRPCTWRRPWLEDIEPRPHVPRSVKDTGGQQ